MSILSNYLRQRRAAKTVEQQIEELENSMDTYEVYKQNDPRISATKAAKETVDTISAGVVAVLATWLSGKLGDNVSPETVAALVTGGVAAWKLISKFLRDYLKKREA